MPSDRTVPACLRVAVIAGLAALVLAAGGPCIANETAQTQPDAPWSRLAPAGRAAADVPQFVAITFDDNFGLAAPGAVGGVKAIVDFYAGKRNSDGSPIGTAFFNTSVYIVDASKTVLGGNSGEDREGRNLAAWKSAVAAGHEMADHTVNHFNGGGIGASKDACCRPRNFSVAQWSAEIASCWTTLTEPGFGLGAKRVSGFRAPYLGFNDAMFTALQNLKFDYDSSVPNCFAADEDGSNCSWPYRLDAGSPDAGTLARKLAAMHPPIVLPAIEPHAGLWELPVTTLIVPPDSAAEQYRFKMGLRGRIAAHGSLPYPSIYDASTGKITGLDYALLIDAGLTGDEMRAVLSYNLDLHLAGNRAPIIFVAHAHLYAFSGADDNPDTPTEADRVARWKGLTEFISYALTKPNVRVVGTGDVLAWMQRALADKQPSP